MLGNQGRGFQSEIGFFVGVFSDINNDFALQTNKSN